MSRVFVLYTGGTIGMGETATGLAPAPGFLEQYLQDMWELSRPEMPSYHLERFDPLMDSANMRPADWVRIARSIAAVYHDYDGFVVLHGTDTMAYTASALSYLLGGLDKSVVITGAQLPLEHVRSDGRKHLVTSLLLAARQTAREVCIYFGGTLLRGNRAQKVHNQNFSAFHSGNLPPLAEVGVDVTVNHHIAPPPKRDPFRWTDLTRDPEVAAVRVYPGMGAPFLRRMLAEPTEGIVLETYGAGTFPSADPELVAALAEATARGVVIVNTSQCHAGRVAQDYYAAGSALARAGVVSGLDMTPEAALTKLYCILAAGMTPQEARARMGENIAGELTP